MGLNDFVVAQEVDTVFRTAATARNELAHSECVGHAFVVDQQNRVAYDDSGSSSPPLTMRSTTGPSPLSRRPTSMNPSLLSW